MSALSPVRTAPPGSAIATTSASTADPARARLRISAARRAVVALTDESTMHVFKKRSVFASRLSFPYSDSTSANLGDEFVEISVGLVEGVLAFEFGAKGDLQ